MPRIRRLGIAAVMTAAIALGGAPVFAAEAVGGAEAVVASASTLQHAGFWPDAHRVAARSTSPTQSSSPSPSRSSSPSPSQSSSPSPSQSSSSSPSQSSSSGSTEHGRGFLWMVAAACIGLISLAIKGTKDSQESESAGPEPAPTSDDTARRARLKAREERLRAAEEAHHRVQGANKRLVEAAELVRTAEQEWDYARAQFGLSATERFHRQVEEAKAALSRGYDTQKRIQAAVVPQTRMRLAAEMSNDLDAALSPLRAATAEFTAKRAEHAALPSRIAQARERLAEELADLERAREELASIATIYPAKTLASLQGNPERAAQLLESARDALETASATVTKDNARAASALDTASRALTMARRRARSSLPSPTSTRSRIASAPPSGPFPPTSPSLRASRPTRRSWTRWSPTRRRRSPPARPPLSPTTARSRRSTTCVPCRPGSASPSSRCARPPRPRTQRPEVTDHDTSVHARSRHRGASRGGERRPTDTGARRSRATALASAPGHRVINEPQQCDRPHIIVNARRPTIMYLVLFATNQGG